MAHVRRVLSSVPAAALRGARTAPWALAGMAGTPGGGRSRRWRQRAPLGFDAHRRRPRVAPHRPPCPPGVLVPPPAHPLDVDSERETPCTRRFRLGASQRCGIGRVNGNERRHGPARGRPAPTADWAHSQGSPRPFAAMLPTWRRHKGVGIGAFAPRAAAGGAAHGWLSPRRPRRRCRAAGLRRGGPRAPRGPAALTAR